MAKTLFEEIGRTLGEVAKTTLNVIDNLDGEKKVDTDKFRGYFNIEKEQHNKKKKKNKKFCPKKAKKCFKEKMSEEERIDMLEE